MEIRTYYLPGLGHASYLIVDRESQTAAVVDPQRDVEQYLRDAERAGVVIKHVLLTHFHSHLLTGHIELRNRASATIYLGDRGRAEFPHCPLVEGQRIEFGRTRLEVLETPGHTREGVSLLAFDRSLSEEEPQAVFTGETLLLGDVGRPNPYASGAVAVTDLAEMLYDSLAKLTRLPDGTRVYPAHRPSGPGGEGAAREEVATIGRLKRENPGLQPIDRAAFVRRVAAELPETPRYYAYDAERNRQDRPDLESTLRDELEPLTVNEVLRFQEEGAQVLDVRHSAAFEHSHLAGALNIPLGSRFSYWAGALMELAKPAVLIADPGEETEAATCLGRIGMDNVVGFLGGGMHALAAHAVLLRRTVRLSATALAEHLRHENAPALLDVRTERESSDGHIAGSVNVPLLRLPNALDRVPTLRPLVVYCQGGYEAAIAASLLQREGFEGVNVLIGGLDAWRAAELPVETAGAAAG